MRILALASIILLVNVATSECSYGCLYCADDNETCLFCDIRYNYTLEEDSCVRVNYENCIGYTIDGVCVKCETGYYLHPLRFRCEEVPAESVIENCEFYTSDLRCMTCKSNFYIQDGNCVAVSNPLAGCEVYMNGKPDTCVLCNEAYRLARDGKNCIIKTNIPNCKTFTDIKCDQCKEGYEHSDNYYILDGLNLTNDTQRDNLRNWLYSNNTVRLNNCKKQKVSNCKKFRFFDVCEQCEDNHYLDSETNECMAYPLDGIPNCAEYENPTKCLNCNSDYFLESEGVCAPVVSIVNCIEYDTKADTTICTHCNNAFKLVENRCELRSASEIITNCERHHPSEARCERCETDYMTTDDGAKCILTIENCDQYENSNVYSIFAVCSFCKPLYTYIPSESNDESGRCVEGTVENCRIYQADNLCYECKHGYALQGTDCVLHNEVEHCSAYERTRLHSCNTCLPDYMLFGLFNVCLETVPINNCEEFENQNRCKKCSNGFRVVVNPENTERDMCEVIPANLFCLQYDDDYGCTVCENEYVNDNGTCVNTHDYLKENCEVDNADGEITFQDYSCSHCKDGHYFFDVNTFFICTAVDDQKTENCSKYRRDEIDLTFKCVQCKPGYYLTHRQDCATSCEEGYIALLEEIRKSTSGSEEDNYESYEVTALRQCIEVPNDSFDGCEILAPNTSSQDLSTTPEYACVRCRSGHIPILAHRATTRFSYIDLSSLNGPYSTYGALECIPIEGNVKGDVNVTTGLVDNCLYYYNVSKQDSQVYGCFTCRFGYTGTIVTSNSNNYYGYIEQCNDFSTTDCDTSVVYQGYTLDFQEIYDWQIPLESMLSCHKCLDSNKIPVLFINYANWRGDTGYRSGSSEISNYHYFTTSLKHAVLNPYSIRSDAYHYGTGGAQMACMTPTHTNFAISSSGNFNILTSGGVSSSCALLLVSASQTPNASCSSYGATYNDVSHCQTIFCAACSPGYRKSKIQRTFLNDNSRYPFQSPYYASGCTAISNCVGNQWVNFCSQCVSGYTWKYNPTTKAVNYDECVSTSISNCEAADDDGACVYCKKGYILQSEGYCDQIKSPFCIDDRSIETRSFEVTGELIYNFMGTTGLYLQPHHRGCDLCEEGYAAFQQTGRRMTCLSSQYLQNMNEGNETESYIFTKHCKNYSFDPANFEPICAVCKDGYTMTNRYNCVQADDLDNCQLAIESTVDDETVYFCETCRPGFIFLNSVCVTGTITRCTKYTISKTSTSQNCEECADGYYSTGDACVLGTIDNCLVYNSQTDCARCNQGYYAIKLKDNVSFCLEIPNRLHCDYFDSANFESGDMICSTCSRGYIALSRTVDDPASYCFKFPSVENCIKYDRKTRFSDSTLECTQCGLEYYLDTSTNTCVKRSKIDPNCNYLLRTEDRCIRCRSGYFLDAPNSACLKNPEGINNCRVYTSATTCTACTENNYLTEGICAEVPTSDQRANCKYYNSDLSCSECQLGYALELGDCNEGSIEHCHKYESASRCEVCEEGYGRKADDEDIICIEIEDVDCELRKELDPHVCLHCRIGYYPRDGVCTEASEVINKCLIYETATTCMLCESDYAISIDKRTCDKSTLVDTYKDPNCLSTRIVSPAICSTCKPGHYLEEMECKACEIDDDSCYFCDINEPSVCLMCASGYYTDEGKCVANPFKDGSTDEGGGGSENTTNIIKVTFFVFIAALLLIKG